MKFSLMFFASSEEALSGRKYQLILDSARFADLHGFASLWVPERHFTEFGSLYPNPAVLQAALAVTTSRLQLRAGSVVAPLHNPLRIAEEWSVVDNLSGGRVGVSFASGWNPGDFILAPDKYADRQEQMLAGLRTVQHLWRGGVVQGKDGAGKEISARIYPTPIQAELPVWITAAGNPQSFIRAGESGTHLLTHILDQDPEQLAEKIKLYREARSRKGFAPEAGIVTVMLHTFVGSDAQTVREEARAPFCNYIRRNIGLLNGLARSRGVEVDINTLPAQALDEFVDFLYERFAQTRGLIGTPESCLPLLRQLEAMGVNEAACLLDFGPAQQRILTSLPQLARLQDLYRSQTQTRIEFDVVAVQARCTQCLTEEEFNHILGHHGLQVEGDFRGVRRIWRRNGEALGEICLPASAATTMKSPYQVHPAFLDACSRVLAACVDGSGDDVQRSYVPAGAAEIRLCRLPERAEAWSHVTLRDSGSADTLQGDVRIYDVAGRLLIQINGLQLKRMNGAVTVAEDLTHYIYAPLWQTMQRGSDSLPATQGEWLVVGDRRGVGARLTDLLRQSGRRCSLLDTRAATRLPTLPERSLEGVVYCPALDLAAADIAGRKAVTADALRWVRALSLEESRARGAAATRLWVLTAGAMAVNPGDKNCVAQAALWGLGRAIGIEHPGLWGGLIDLDPADVFNPALLSALLSSESESMVALRGGAQKFVPRIVRAGDRAGLAGASARLRFAAEASYLVTGGLGGLGLRLAAWLLERGAGAVALLGRSEPVTGALEGLPEGRVRVLRGDVSRREDVAAALAQIQQSMPPLRGVFHLAGALDDGRLLDQDIERFYNAGTGKAEGAWHLHELTRDLALDHFVMFSSMASLVTTHGQGNYASANSVADALAHLRRAESRAALSVNWGPWARIGHAATDYGRGAHERLAQLGVKALSPDTSLAALERLMMTDVTQAAVIDVDWQRLALADPAAAAAPLLSELFAASPAVAAASAVETALVKDLKAGAMTGRLEKVTAVLARMLAQVLRLADAQAISRTRAFMEMGLDSILALELTRQISAVFGRSFSATLLFKCPNLESLAPFLLSAVLPEREEETRTAGSSRPPGEESDSQAAKRLAGGKPRSAPTLASAGTATEDTAGSGVGSAARAEGAESELSEAELSELILEEIGSR